jgi:hypothetical protein
MDGRAVVTVSGQSAYRLPANSTPSTHYSRLRSIESAFGLVLLGQAGNSATATIPALADPSPRAR